MPRLEMTHESMRHYYRGRVFESTGEVDIAVEEYRKAIDLGADYADVHNSLGRVFAKRGMFDEAKKEFNLALEMNPQYLEAHRNLDELETKLDILKEDKAIRKEKAPLSMPEESVQPAGAAAEAAGGKPYIRIVVAAAAVCALAVMGAVLVPQIIPQGRIASYISPSTNITGIAYDGRVLWMCDWLKQEVYQCTVNSRDGFMVKDTYKLSTMYPLGITIGNGYLWTCDAWSKKIYQHVPDANLTVIKSFDTPGGSPSGLSWDGNNIWSCDSGTNKIYRHGTDELLTVKAAYPTPAERLIGFFWDGKYYWSVDGTKGVLYKHRKDANLSVVDSVALSMTNKKIGGISIDKKYVWIAYEGEGLLVRYPIRKVLK